MKEKEKEYRILKLKSGESIIARIKEVDKDKGSVILHRPMSLKLVTLFDEMTGPEEQICIKRYNNFSLDTFVEIPTNHVVSVLRPDKNSIEIYDREKIFEDNPQLKMLAQKRAEHELIQKMIQKQKRLQEIARQMGIEFEEEDEHVPHGPPRNFSALMLPDDAIEQLLEMMGLDWRRSRPKKKRKSSEPDPSEDGLEPDPDDWGYGCRWQDWDIDDFEVT